MRHLTVPPKVVAYYSERTERNIRKMCERREVESEFVGGGWLISCPGLKSRFWRLGKGFWHHVCYDFYKDERDAEEAFQEYLEIAAVERSRERERESKDGT